MNNWDGQCDMSHSFSTNFLASYFHSASIAYNSAISYSFVFSTMTFIILYRTKYLFTEKTVFFGFIRPVLIVSGFRISPYDLARIFSGDAKLIVILEYFLFVSILFDCIYVKSSPFNLIQRLLQDLVIL